MKKFLATLLTATMVASLLAGCGGNEQQDVPENPTQSDDASGADDAGAGKADDADQAESTDTQQAGSGSYAA